MAILRMPEEKILRSPGRRAAREFSLRALYAVESSGGTLEEVFDYLFQEHEFPEDQLDFSLKLCKEVLAGKDHFDKLIARRLKNWELNRIARVDRIVLWIALAEFFSFSDIPPKVSIDEAIELARKYSSTDSPAFVNGILDSIAKNDLGIIPEREGEVDKGCDSA